MTDEEIQETVTNQEKEEVEEEISHQCTGPSAQESIQNFDNIITWLYQEADVDPFYLLNIKTVRRHVLSKVKTSCKHTDSRAMFTRPPTKESQPATLLPLGNRQAINGLTCIPVGCISW